MHYLIVSALHESGIDCAEGDQTLTCQPSREGYCVLLSDADIVDAFRVGLEGRPGHKGLAHLGVGGCRVTCATLAMRLAQVNKGRMWTATPVQLPAPPHEHSQYFLALTNASPLQTLSVLCHHPWQHGWPRRVNHAWPRQPTRPQSSWCMTEPTQDHRHASLNLG